MQKVTSVSLRKGEIAFCSVLTPCFASESPVLLISCFLLEGYHSSASASKESLPHLSLEVYRKALPVIPVSQVSVILDGYAGGPRLLARSQNIQDQGSMAECSSFLVSGVHVL